MKISVSGSARNWICKLAAKLRPHLGKFASAEDVLYPVFKEINYLTYDELKALNVKLAKLDQEAPLFEKREKGMPW